MSIIKTPNLGDGIQSATVLSIFVKVGDTISLDQTLLELETDKATAPIPANEAGKISKILVKEGDTISTGMPIFELEGSTSSVQNLIPPASPSTPLRDQPSSTARIETRFPSNEPRPLSGVEGPTSPSVRKIAQEIGLDLRLVPTSDPAGRITLPDIRNYISALIAAPRPSTPLKDQGAESDSKAQPLSRVEGPDFSKWGTIEKKPTSSLRKKIGQKMVDAWTKIPHVTQFEDIDITDLMALRAKHNPTYKAQGLNLTLTVFALKAIVSSLKAFPLFNSSYDDHTSELVFKNYYHIGIAVDTENGLIVPVVKNVDQKSVLELCKEVSELAEKARTRKISLEDLQGGTFTITNLGSLGVSHFTPIINAPEVAILGLSTGKLKPVTLNNKIESRLIMPIALSYDHRIIDGADGARFIRNFIDALTQFDESWLI